MCGINGVWNFKHAAEAMKMMEEMNRVLAHRGPDASGTWQGEKVIFGHRRLSIIDTSTASNQPFLSKDKNTVIIFNGEIYNYIELKKELQSEFIFQTDSDTEVILAAFQKWGIRCVDRLIGMFAFALYDIPSQTCFIVRDRLGIKPIYFFNANGEFIFSSEIRALLATKKIARKIDEDALCDYLRYQTVHTPKTIVRGINMLDPGTYLILSGDQIKSVRYWQVSDQIIQPPADRNIATVHRDIRELLYSSVEMRMRSDVPFGAFLSGGIDSSAVVGIMSEISSQPIKTFSITFHEKQWDESSYATQIAQRFKTDHTDIRLSATDFLQWIPYALDAMDHPSGDGPNTYIVSRMTKNAGVKMALSGLGGDELFAGYPVFQRIKKMDENFWLKKSPHFARILAAKTLSAVKPSVATEKISEVLKKTSIDFSSVYPVFRQLFTDDRIKMMINQKKIAPNGVVRMADEIAGYPMPLLSKISVAEMSSYMQNVLLRDTDQMSMANALEVRVPFLDHRLVQYVLGVPDDQKFPHTPKQLLTDSLKEMIPREIINRPKMGFTFPWSLWMKTELREMCEENLTFMAETEYFKKDAVMKLWDQFISNDARTSWAQIWIGVTLGYWMKKNDVK